MSSEAGRAFIALRDRVLAGDASDRRDPCDLEWPACTHFNWARDYFDQIALGNTRTALRVVGKIRRVELRRKEMMRDLTVRAEHEFWEEDFPEGRGSEPEAARSA